MLSFSNKNFSHFGIFFPKNTHIFFKILNVLKLNQDLFFNFSYIIRRVNSFWNFFRRWSYVLNINSNWFQTPFFTQIMQLCYFTKIKNLECRRLNQFFAHSIDILKLSRISVAYLKLFWTKVYINYNHIKLFLRLDYLDANCGITKKEIVSKTS